MATGRTDVQTIDVSTKKLACIVLTVVVAVKTPNHVRMLAKIRHQEVQSEEEDSDCDA